MSDRVLDDAGSSRRRFLVAVTGAGLSAAVFGACGDDDDAVGSGDGGSGDGADRLLSAARFFGPYYLAGRPARVPFGLADDDGILPVALSPDEVTVSVRAPDGTMAAEGLRTARFDEGLPRPYYAVTFTPAEPGFYDLVIDTGADGEVTTQVQIVEVGDPVAAAIIGPGDPMPALSTPTTADPRGVDPICTRDPDCDLHDRTVAEVLAAGEPMALLVATPAFCQTVVCGPVLDVLLGELGAVPGVTAVHAEVFSDPSSNSVPPVPDDFAPVVTDLGLVFEPVLYTVGSDGVVVDRLDYIFGADEIRTALEGLV